MTAVDTTSPTPTAVLDESTALSRRQAVLLTVLLGTQFMLSVDFSILNVAMPAIGSGVGIGTSELQWIATAFALPAAGFTLLFGRVGDVVGRRRLFVAGLILLLLASVLGGLANTPAVLLTARVLQGLSAAMTVPAALSLITTSFAEGPMRSRALGLNGALLSGGFTIGALVGGVLTDGPGWRWAFLLNVPVAAAALALTPLVVPSGRAMSRTPLDLPGAFTVSTGLLSLVFGVTQAAVHGWLSARVLASLIAALVLFSAFIIIEVHASAPLASVRILRRPTVLWGNIGGFVVFSMESSIVFLMTIYLQRVLGFSALRTGLVFGIPGLAAVAAGVLAPRAIGRWGAPRVLVFGLLVQAACNVPLLALAHQSRVALVLSASLLVGFLGHVSAIVGYTVTATSGLPDEEQGLATALTTLTQQVAITVGIPVLSSVVVARQRAVGAGSEALLAGVHTAVAVDIAITVAATIAVAIGVRARPAQPEVAVRNR